jgi:hypothetical protein
LYMSPRRAANEGGESPSFSTTLFPSPQTSPSKFGMTHVLAQPLFTTLAPTDTFPRKVREPRETAPIRNGKSMV